MWLEKSLIKMKFARLGFPRHNISTEYLSGTQWDLSVFKYEQLSNYYESNACQRDMEAQNIKMGLKLLGRFAGKLWLVFIRNWNV